VRSYAFLLSRRWIGFAVVVAVLAAGTWWLGEWQFGRLDERQTRNAIVRGNEGLDPAPVSEVMSDAGPAAGDEWRLVTATGTYDVSRTVVVRYRSGADGQPGVDAVVPLVTASGTALAVDRGFLATDTRAVDPTDLPTPPSGEVTVTGWVRLDGTGSSTEVEDASTRAVSSATLGEAWGLPTYGGFVDLAAEDPAPAGGSGLERTELPELDNGPHFFYGLQWWFFGALALFGFGYLAYDERKRGPHGERRTRQRLVPLSQRVDPTQEVETVEEGTVREAVLGRVEKVKAGRPTRAPRELTKSQAERLAASEARRRR